jgi:putative acyl-CoA dehydrogenase
LLVGMAMTEKQGGSDVRANTTVAEPAGAPGEYVITGHKWFCSAPMCDAFLVLAQASQGLTCFCFLLPRWTPDGAKNNFFIQRLKDKMGNRANASSEVEFAQAWARRVGEEGRGVSTIIEMVNHTRLDCAVASAGLMRQALAQAVHHARHRAAFGKLLIDQPLMRNVLADLALESEAATLLVMRVARGFDARATDALERAFCRVATAVAKYWLCKRAPVHVNEALECLGGNGYVEESMMPRLYREAPLYSIWEGSGNVICLDILRALTREPEAAEALLHELKRPKGADPRLTAYLAHVETDLAAQLKHTSDSDESGARGLAERLALALQATLVADNSAPAVADAFIASRLAGDHGENFGTLSSKVDVNAIINPVAAGLAES